MVLATVDNSTAKDIVKMSRISLSLSFIISETKHIGYSKWDELDSDCDDELLRFPRYAPF